MKTAQCKQHRHQGSRRGGAAVEFALIMPSMVALVLGCVDFGRFSYDYQAVVHAAHAGAEFAGIHPPNSITVNLWVIAVRKSVANEMGTRSGFNSSNVTVTRITEANGQIRDRIFVPYKFKTVFYWQWLGIPSTINMQSVAQMRELPKVIPP